MWFLLLLAFFGLLIYGLYVYGNDVSLSNLRHLLRTQQWKEACEETENLLWLNTARDIRGNPRLSPEEVQRFPCNKLQAIERLWIQYSDGYFGLSVQASIYKSISLNPSERKEIQYLGRGLKMSVEQLKAWEDLGWSYRYYYESTSRKNDCHYTIKDWHYLDFSRYNVPRGHLPIFFNYQGSYPSDVMVDWWERILSCNSGRG